MSESNVIPPRPSRMFVVAVSATALVSAASLALSTYALFRPQQPAPAPRLDQSGRFMIVFNPSVRADQYLLDTITGCNWRSVTVDRVTQRAMWQLEDVQVTPGLIRSSSIGGSCVYSPVGNPIK
jgi:hypothetical protein